MTKRWQQRPPGSTWGDWGEDDELGRINLLTPEKVLQGIAEVHPRIAAQLEEAPRVKRGMISSGCRGGHQGQQLLPGGRGLVHAGVGASVQHGVECRHGGLLAEGGRPSPSH